LERTQGVCQAAAPGLLESARLPRPEHRLALGTAPDRAGGFPDRALSRQPVVNTAEIPTHAAWFLAGVLAANPWPDPLRAGLARLVSLETAGWRAALLRVPRHRRCLGLGSPCPRSGADRPDRRTALPDPGPSARGGGSPLRVGPAAIGRQAGAQRSGAPARLR